MKKSATKVFLIFGFITISILFLVMERSYSARLMKIEDYIRAQSIGALIVDRKMTISETEHLAKSRHWEFTSGANFNKPQTMVVTIYPSKPNSLPFQLYYFVPYVVIEFENGIAVRSLAIFESI